MPSAKVVDEIGLKQLETTAAAAEIFDKFKPMLDARGMGCIVILANLGEMGALSYIANIAREDAVTCLFELMDNLDDELVERAFIRWDLARRTRGKSEKLVDVEQN